LESDGSSLAQDGRQMSRAITPEEADRAHMLLRTRPLPEVRNLTQLSYITLARMAKALEAA
jgi:hypothetical protein